ncbi:uncharacterized protein EI90DRAFT_2309936 [Cantharellus anzutake]|uniref:uncharacterized protein n=1 Tax=Cantharellus anzutake TaxID=1750568 RepID=UPI001906A732|nr:uncharacterized protein EI90DRAFT_2309936 [Cantharellus anzutake]KAF8339960.1 hypothetical protein EI90DRAFT_2309936 [Cantharellus anzutake]
MSLHPMFHKPSALNTMSSRCLICRLKRKGCVESPDSPSCVSCSRMRVECIPCSIRIPCAVKKSARARECLLEVKSLAEPRRSWIARLPKARRFIRSLQPLFEDSSGQGAADEENPTEPTDLPEASPPTAVFSTNYVNTTSPINRHPHTFLVGTSTREGNFDEEPLVDLHTQTLFPPFQPSSERFASICPILPDMMPCFPSFAPNFEMTSHFENSIPMLSDAFHHPAIPDQLSVPDPSCICNLVPNIAVFEPPDCPQDRRMVEKLEEDVVYWLRGLTQRLGYFLVPLNPRA